MDVAQLRAYYLNDFPANYVWQFMCVSVGGSASLAQKLEISLEKQGGFGALGEIITIRFLSVSSAADLRRLLVLNTPVSVGLGAAHFVPGDLRPRVKADLLRPLCKPLFLDFDASDFSRQCECDGEKRVCVECWSNSCCGLMTSAKDASLSVTGAAPLFVFSGRRGVHLHFPGRLAHLSATDRRRFVSLMEGQISKDGTGDIFDTEVTTSMEHTIRLPFTVHPSSGCLVLPVDPSTTFKTAELHVSMVATKKGRFILPQAWAKAVGPLTEWASATHIHAEQNK